MYRSLLFLLLACSSVVAEAQRKRPDIFPIDGKMRRNGLYVAPGVTWTLAPGDQPERELYRSGDTTMSALFDPAGRLGPYIEVGWFHAPSDPYILNYWDFGLAYKQLRGRGAYNARYAHSDTAMIWTGENAFSDGYLALHANANKLFSVTDNKFIQVTLGANLDYRLGSGRDYAPLTAMDGHWGFPPDLVGQLHFKLGFGFKVNKRLLIIPAVETPIFSVTPQDDGRFGALDWFNTPYRPLIFSVRFLFLRYPKGYDCPPPIKHNNAEKRKVVNPSYERR